MRFDCRLMSRSLPFTGTDIGVIFVFPLSPLPPLRERIIFAIFPALFAILPAGLTHGVLDRSFYRVQCQDVACFLSDVGLFSSSYCFTLAFKVANTTGAYTNTCDALGGLFVVLERSVGGDAKNKGRLHVG